MAATAHLTLDACVRMVTACSSFADLKDTQPSYAPTFYPRTFSKDEWAAARRVVKAFNAWASRPENGRQRLAHIHGEEQPELPLQPRREPSRSKPMIDRLLAVLKRQGFDCSRTYDGNGGHKVYRPCLGGTPIDWSVKTDVRGLPAQGLWDSLCGLFCCGRQGMLDRAGYSDRRLGEGAAS